MSSPPIPSRKADDYYFDADTLWGRESTRLLAAIVADPSNRQLRIDFEVAEQRREAAYEKRRALWEREQEREEADEWMAWAGSDEQTFDTMSGGTIVR